MTARELLDALRPFAPTFDPASGKYRLRPDAPPDLVARVRVLNTGVAALLAGRAWLGCHGSTTGRVVKLSPGEPVPDGVTLLSLLPETGHGWDRLPPNARLDLPDLFAAATPAQPAAAKPSLKGAHL